ncbi:MULTISPECIES: hypothetical protein [unclassified Bosea (in: a-proteobacteria)]|uniref:hypothetical protein n=1 Tax=unclassified Bosea (in: a-proteobacteria) TaxID=2653178 RepID=UPI000F75B909|nr:MULTISPECIES: hypothetical protein [unclassified Bosea (in: a-proteobacteria)]AZO82129.1 hypothetical protein BLM15_30575 [Bosea sp. Tri-49]RXT18875.1 hypothetical protein B5U98_22560 [Bosea sp. Tri-39]RXT34720.1 hypothetical protein B5U99_18025 [Bosea sp. Tri-54]
MSQPRIVDPDDVPETFVQGPFSCTVTGHFATLTFTHERPVAEKLLAGPSAGLSLEAVVRARLIMPVEGLKSLRDSIDQLLRGLDAANESPGSPRGH